MLDVNSKLDGNYCVIIEILGGFAIYDFFQCHALIFLPATMVDFFQKLSEKSSYLRYYEE